MMKARNIPPSRKIVFCDMYRWKKEILSDAGNHNRYDGVIDGSCC